MYNIIILRVGYDVSWQTPCHDNDLDSDSNHITRFMANTGHVIMLSMQLRNFYSVKPNICPV